MRRTRLSLLAVSVLIGITAGGQAAGWWWPNDLSLVVYFGVAFAVASGVYEVLDRTFPRRRR